MISIPTNEKIIEAVFLAIEEVNRQISEKRQINKSENTLLLGNPGHLESVDLVSLIVAVEQEIENAFHQEISLTDQEDSIFESNGPLRTIGTLVHHISNLLEQ